MVLVESFFGIKKKPRDAKLHLSAYITKPVFNLRIEAVCLECQRRFFAKLGRLVGYAAQLSKGFLTGGIDGMKKAAMVAVYDADVENIDISFESLEIQDIRITDMQKSDENPDNLQRLVPNLSENAKKAANFLYNGVLKSDLQKEAALGMQRDMRRELEKARPNFYRSVLEEKYFTTG